MYAARASHAERPPGARSSRYPLRKAAFDYDVGEKLVRDASALLQSGMGDLIQSVDEGKALSTAYKEYLTAKRAGRNPESVKADSGQWLYLITEGFKGSKWSKIGVGDLPGRFDEAQRGNPRKLRLAGAWWFPSDPDARKVEEMIKEDKSLPKAPGGSEWREGMTASYVNEIAVSKDGRRSLPPEFNRMGFRRVEGSNRLPKAGIAKTT